MVLKSTKNIFIKTLIIRVLCNCNMDMCFTLLPFHISILLFNLHRRKLQILFLHHLIYSLNPLTLADLISVRKFTLDSTLCHNSVKSILISISLTSIQFSA